jgi:glycosyltransferase involved in cell wall biosynthesis
LTDRPLRIGIDARLVGGNHGGVEQFVIGLAYGLSSLGDGDEEYIFLTLPGEGDWILPYIKGPCRSLPVREGNVLESYLRGAIRRWFPLVRETYHHISPLFGEKTIPVPRSDGTAENAGIDLMHFTVQTAFLTDIPSIYHPHDLQHLYYPKYFTPRERLAREVLYPLYCERAKMVAVASNWVRRDVIDKFFLPPEKVHVIPFAPPIDAYPSPTPDDLVRACEKFSLEREFVYYPAATWPHKNHISLLEALAILRDRDGIRVPAVFSGKQNSYFPEVERRARKLGLSDQVRFLGFVSPLELQCLYRLARCVVIPTQFEAASFPIWEAFGAGVPVACSNVTSLPEQAGEAAILFSPENRQEIADAIRRLWTDEGLRKNLIGLARSKISNLSWKNTARLFRFQYRRLSGLQVSVEDYEEKNDDNLIRTTRVCDN